MIAGNGDSRFCLSSCPVRVLLGAVIARNGNSIQILTGNFSSINHTSWVSMFVGIDSFGCTRVE